MTVLVVLRKALLPVSYAVSSLHCLTLIHYFTFDQQDALDNLVDIFVDQSDPDFDFKDLQREISEKCQQGHWKAAVRKLKRLSRKYGSAKTIPAKIYEEALEACMLNRLQGARASEPARKILEQMAESGYQISESSGNYCIKNCLDETGPDSTHQGFGGLDTALAMKTALEIAGTPIQLETKEKLAVAYAREGSVDESLALTRSFAVENEGMLETPALATYARIADAIVRSDNSEHAKQIPTLMSYAKAAGYDLDNIAAMGEDGISLLASGVMAAERLDNTALGLRFLTAGRKLEGGDKLVAKYSQAANRASTRLHQRAINQAVKDSGWKLAVKLLTLMLERDLRPSPWVWRNVVTCCAKAKKSKKATAVLLDWVRLHEEGKAESPPLSVFNTCVNACEICDEHELTLLVLDAMKKTHDTDGNIVTFNIALKRLAKLGNTMACEGIIVGMLQSGIEPSVVSYTTAIAACAYNDNRQPAVAYEWLKRMRSRLVRPNVLTYNTALATCLEGGSHGELLASEIAKEMLADAGEQACNDGKEYDQYSNVLPDSTTKMLARQILGDIKKTCEENGVEESEELCKPLLELSEYEAVCDLAEFTNEGDENRIAETEESEVDLEFTAASSTHRVAEV